MPVLQAPVEGPSTALDRRCIRRSMSADCPDQVKVLDKTPSLFCQDMNI